MRPSHRAAATRRARSAANRLSVHRRDDRSARRPGDSLARDRHLFGPGPKRILALDGGGVRGAISVAFLERIEKIIQEEQQRDLAAAGNAPHRAGSPAPPKHRTRQRAPRRLAWRLFRSGRRHVDRRGDRRRAGARQEHGGDQGLLPEARAAHLLAVALAGARITGEVRRWRLAGRDRQDRRGPRGSTARICDRALRRYQAARYRQSVDPRQQFQGALLEYGRRRSGDQRARATPAMPSTGCPIWCARAPRRRISSIRKSWRSARTSASSRSPTSTPSSPATRGCRCWPASSACCCCGFKRDKAVAAGTRRHPWPVRRWRRDAVQQSRHGAADDDAARWLQAQLAARTRQAVDHFDRHRLQPHQAVVQGTWAGSGRCG